MADHKLVPEDRKSRYVAPLIVAAVIIALLVIVIFRTSFPAPAPPVVIPPTVAKISKVRPAIANLLPPPVLTRKDLIESYRQSAATFAATGKLPFGLDSMVGRRFSIRIAFGCNGLQGDPATAQVTSSYDTENQTVTLTAQPGGWTTLPLIQSISDMSEIENVEGFWMPRPWVEVDGCPSRMIYPVPATPTPPTTPTLGLAQIFLAGSSRVSERWNKPYSFTRRIAPDGSGLLGHSYRLLLEGKISEFSRGHALQCWVEASDHAPICLYAVEFNHVAFEDGDTGEVLADWNN